MSEYRSGPGVLPAVFWLVLWCLAVVVLIAVYLGAAVKLYEVDRTEKRTNPGKACSGVDCRCQPFRTGATTPAGEAADK